MHYVIPMLTTRHPLPYVLLLALMLLLAACGSNGAPKNDSTDTSTGPAGLYGTIIDSDGDPVPGANVQVHVTSSTPTMLATQATASTTTDENGTYQFTSLVDGTYNLVVNAGGLAGFEANITIEGTARVDVDITIRAAGQITGTVRRSGESDHSGILVFVPGSSFIATTAADGSFLMSGVPQGEYDLQARTSAFAPTNTTVTAEAGRKTTLPSSLELPVLVDIGFIPGQAGPELAFGRKMADAYMSGNPHVIDGVARHVTVEILTPEEPDLAYYQAAFTAQNDRIDVFQIDVIWPAIIGEHLEDLNEHGAATIADRFAPNLLTHNTVDGRLVGLPWFFDAGLLYYRTDLLAEHGYTSPPATWTDLETMAHAIQEAERENGNTDFHGFVWQGNDYEGLTTTALEWIASNDGGTIVSPEGVITIDNPRAVEALEKAAAWVGTISPTSVTRMDEEGARAIFQAGDAAFMRNWPYAYALAQGEDSAVAGKVGIAPLPAHEGGRSVGTLGGAQLAVSKYSDDPAIATDFALFLTNEENQAAYANEVGMLPTIPALYEADDTHLEPHAAWMKDFAPVLEATVDRPSTVTGEAYSDVSYLFHTAVHQVLTGAQDAGESLTELEQDLVDLIGFSTGTP